MIKKVGTLKTAVTIALCAAILLCMFGCDSSPKSALDPKSPATVTVWNYYNGDQLAAFDSLVEDFNSTVGLEKGIVVVGVSQGDIGTLADSLIASANGEAGAQEKPVLAAVYAETAYILDNSEALEPMDSYFTAEELATYVPGFIDEGRFNEENQLLTFPILKSTELFTINETDWKPFGDDTGITIDTISCKEDLTAAAKAYYEWTDAQTPDIAEDGKALYGRDSMANYLFIGSYQLGHELFKVENGQMTMDFDRDTFKILWDNYYIPYINGYFGAYAKFRSEDCKTGKILALTSSSSSVSYLPTAVTLEDDETHDIVINFRESLPFANAVNNAIVQQGANYCMLKSTPGQIEGAVEFLKWFSQSERNLDFASMSGYSPVTLSANTQDAIMGSLDGKQVSPKDSNVLSSLLLCANSFTNSQAYASKPFNGSKEVRSLLEDAMTTIAQADREAVIAEIAAGSSREDAVAKYMTDEYFDEWFNDLTAQVSQITGK